MSASDLSSLPVQRGAQLWRKDGSSVQAERTPELTKTLADLRELAAYLTSISFDDVAFRGRPDYHL